MKRRPLLTGLSVCALSGCLSLGETDTDGDGTVDRNDAAPHDSRVRDYIGGDPPPDVTMQQIATNNASSTMTVRLTHAGGAPFTAADTDRLELSVTGTAIDTIALPFEVGDQRVVTDVPLGERVVLIWFPSTDEPPAVISAIQSS